MPRHITQKIIVVIYLLSVVIISYFILSRKTQGVLSMREIMKILPVPVDGKSQDFRLTKLDAFSGAALLRMLSGMPKDPGRMDISGAGA